jgi:four helix bundle protein
MSTPRYARSFRELIVYQKARAVERKIFELTKTFPPEERYSLTDQVRRSSRSVGAQIAEAWGKRRYERHFVSKLTDADAEHLETQHWIDVAATCEYLQPEEQAVLSGDLEEIGRLLHSMILKADTFCERVPGGVRESESEYTFTTHRPPGHRPPITDH